MSKTLMIAGCGDVGSRLGQQLSAAGWTVYGLRRSVALLPQGIRPVAGDLQADACPATWRANRWITWCIARPPPNTMRPAIAPPMSTVCAACLAGWRNRGNGPSACCLSPAVACMANSSVSGWMRLRQQKPIATPGGSCARPSSWLCIADCPPVWYALPASTAQAANGCSSRCAKAIAWSANRRCTATASMSMTRRGYWPICCRPMPVVWSWMTAISASTISRRRCMRWWPGCASSWRSAIGPSSRRCAARAASVAATPAPAPWAGSRITELSRGVPGDSAAAVAWRFARV